MADRPVLLVTGASSGIGRATVLAAAEQGRHVVLVARGAGPLEETAEECRARGAASALTVPLDVGDDDAVADLVASVLRRHGRLDAVVGCAGVVAYGRTESVPVEVFDAVLRTNLTGSVNLARHVVPVLRRQGAGSLLLVGSVVGHLAVPMMSPYVLSKWGVRALARQLAVENRDRPGVQIGYVAPGGVDTPIYRQAANYAGYAGRPPPPVSSPERAARQVLARLEQPWRPAQLSLANDVLRFGFSFLPLLYDRLVGPAFPVGATDLATRADPGPGNVLTPSEGGNRLRGGYPGAAGRLRANLRLRRRLPDLG
ncbi:SDR family NAD(P)-dependent oxidoreductase [Nocardioides dongxiaopingii]|uniref:SDR family NAD(P)-dependent oxidoreductase n=1 Tax=Nocardioides sp. S-1144 TaxID=2582905 RepID=UPI001651B324|nr:SDR family NAD(P)-dependent oxidoreductase [Nocardioides sp. S-1144]